MNIYVNRSILENISKNKYIDWNIQLLIFRINMINFPKFLLT